jgi:hypothetical protein
MERSLPLAPLFPVTLSPQPQGPRLGHTTPCHTWHKYCFSHYRREMLLDGAGRAPLTLPRRRAPGAVRQERMDQPPLDRTPRGHADCYACIGRGRLLLVEPHIAAITATTCLRESREAGGSTLRREQARDSARTYGDMAGLQPSRARRSVNFRTPKAMDTSRGRRGNAPAVGGL